MKKLVSLVLLLTVVLCLTGCSKPTLKKLLDYPTGASVEEMEKFLEDCGYKPEKTAGTGTDTAITFTHGKWDGRAEGPVIILSISDDADDKDLDAMRKEIQDICGEPYNETSSNVMADTVFVKEIYTNGNSEIVLTMIKGFANTANILIHPGAGK